MTRGAPPRDARWLDLVVTLASRDLTLRYKGSVLGALWSLAHPLALAAIYTVAFQFVIRIGIPEYPAFLLTGLLPWLFVASALSSGSVAFTDQGALIRKVAFPRDALVASRVAAQAAHFGLAYALVVVPLVVARVGASPALALLPVLAALLVVFAWGAALFLACAQARFRDTRHLLEVGLQIWFWATPVVYALEMVPPAWRPWFALNPMALFVDAFRQVLLGHQWPGAARLAALAAATAASAALGSAVYRRTRARLAERV